MSEINNSLSYFRGIVREGENNELFEEEDEYISGLYFWVYELFCVFVYIWCCYCFYILFCYWI